MTEKNIQQNTIIFRIGEETGIVIEETREQFEHSPFKEQYRQALEVIDDIIRESRKNIEEVLTRFSSNVIAFCGDRGEGKTSALSTVCRILSDRDTFLNAKDTGLLLNTHNLTDNSCIVLPLVDPSFFDEQHNILELIIGQMYEKVASDNNNPQTTEKIQNNGYRPLMEKFAEAKKCLSALVNTDDMYDAISELSRLAANVRLRKAMENLFKAYVDYYKKETIVISVDDIDLNMNEAYKMAENIRKYLCNKYCVILLAVKIDQLQTAIHAAIRNNVDDKDIVSDEQVTEMAQKYVTKFIPENHRVIMPSPDDIIEYQVILYGRDGKLLPNINNLPVKETIVRLIFNKTRYLFYNGRSVSPIVPHNLREIFLLIGLLASLPDVYDADGERIENELLSNKVIFKNYFYKSWVNNHLIKNDREFATQLASYKDIISVNKFVITYLSRRLDVEGIKGKIDNIFNEIVTPENKSHNISVGDVYYVIKQIEAITTDVKIHLLLFFVRAFYSMRLYGLYDSITTESELQNNILVRSGKTSKVRIYKYDSLYEGTNELQKFLNGSYFTYLPGSLINDMSDGNDNTIKCKNRDIRPINGKKLAKMLVDNTSFFNLGHMAYIKAKVVAKEQEDKNKAKEALQYNFTDEFKLSVQRCEYFILCTTHQLISDEAKKDRQSVNPPFIGVYDSIDKKYLYYDFLAIFYNIINMGYAFGRFGKVGKQFYRFVKKFPWTLTSQMTMLNAGDSWPNKAYKLDLVSRYHKLLSDGCIRVSEVQQSIIEELTKNKLSNKHKDNGKNAYKLKRAYEDIQELEISLYPYSKEGDSYRIPFNFLTPVIAYLDKEEKSESNEFDDIYIVRADSIRNNPSTDNDKREFFQQFPAAKKSQAEKRDSIIDVLRKNHPNLPDSKSEFWNDIFPNKRYPKQEWVNISIGAKDKIAKYIR